MPDPEGPGPWLEGVSGTPDLSQDTSVVALTGKAMMYSPEVRVEGTGPARTPKVKSFTVLSLPTGQPSFLHGASPPGWGLLAKGPTPLPRLSQSLRAGRTPPVTPRPPSQGVSEAPAQLRNGTGAQG